MNCEKSMNLSGTKKRLDYLNEFRDFGIIIIQNKCFWNF